MDTSQFESRIRQAEANLKQAREQAESAAGSVQTQVCTFISEWIERVVTRQVTESPEVSKELGLEGLRELKQDLADLRTRLPTLVEEDLGRDALWPHRPEQLNTLKTYLTYENRPPDELDEAIRGLLGHAGEILARHGFEQLGRDSEWEKRGGRFRYRYGYELSEPLKRALRNYGDAHERVKAAFDECKKARRAKEQAEASDLWNRA